MPYAMTLYRPAYVAFNGTKLTDHNRSVVSQSVERIGGQIRTARGSLRKYHVADKLSFDISWEMIPGAANKTVDGFWAADDIINFYNTTTASFTLGLTSDTIVGVNYVVENHTVVFESFTYNVEKRWSRYFYNISLSLTEV